MSEEEKLVNDEIVEEAQKDKKEIVAWIKLHKSQLILVGITKRKMSPESIGGGRPFRFSVGVQSPSDPNG